VRNLALLRTGLLDQAPEFFHLLLQTPLDGGGLALDALDLADHGVLLVFVETQPLLILHNELRGEKASAQGVLRTAG